MEHQFKYLAEEVADALLHLVHNETEAGMTSVKGIDELAFAAAAIDRWRALRPRQQECELNDELAQDWMTERRSTEAEELIAQLLTELPEPDREIFFRRYYYRESCREIGRRLNMQEHTVNVRLSRGREKLRKQFAALCNTY